MRKDYIPVVEATATANETDFVERHWADIWKDQVQPPDLSALARRDEYRIVRPYLAKISKGSRILDGGCGLGEWTVFLGLQGFDVVGHCLKTQWPVDVGCMPVTLQFDGDDLAFLG